MIDAWSWRQYAVYRVMFGAYLFVHFVHLLPWGAELFSRAGMLPDASASPLIGVFPNLLAYVDSPAIVVALLTSGVAGAVALMLGRFDRLAAVWMWFLLACLFGRNPLIANPSLPVVGWLLLFHALLPRPREHWEPAAAGTSGRLPQSYFVMAWFLLAVAYSYSGWTKLFSEAWVQGETVRWVLLNPLARDHWLRELLLATPPILLQAVTIGVLVLELLFAPLALIRRARPWIWAGMLFVQFGFLFLLNFADLTFPMLLLPLLTFDPRWLPSRARAAGTTIYYDGECGLCHTWVRFVLAEDVKARFRYAAMQSPAAKKAIPDIAGGDDYSTFVVLTADGARLQKFAGVRHLLLSLGGLWRVIGLAARLIPVALGDMAYDLVARNRRRLFARPDKLCPLLPPDLSSRFARC
mgnify:CR=1 FL=1